MTQSTDAVGELTVAATTLTADAMTNQLHACIFKRGDRTLAIPVSSVTQIGFVPEVTSIPAAASFLKGVINLRGEIVPVLSIDAAIGLRDTPFSQKHPIVVTQTRIGLVAIIVDRVIAVADIPEIVSGENMEGRDEATYISGLYQYAEDLVALIDHERLIADLHVALQTT